MEIVFRWKIQHPPWKQTSCKLKKSVTFVPLCLGHVNRDRIPELWSAMLWRGAVGGGGLLAETRRQPAAADGLPPSLQIPPPTFILPVRLPAPYSPTTPRRAHSPTAFSGPMVRTSPSRLRVLAMPPSPAHAPRSHPPTGSPDSTTSQVLVLFSRALCARLRVLA
jgi:hypothetical protein